MLVQTTRAVELDLNERLRAELDSSLRPAHYAVFRHLDPAGSRITALAEAAGMTQQSMGELVTHLEGCGYVERQVDPADKRARLVMLTERGREALVVAAAGVADIERRLSRALGREGLTALRSLLARAGKTLTAEDDQPRRSR
ncbi:winged helix-turn-helix transcriptional regulator [Nocardia huaxiensis]|uniref:Winged helix-turn-helix transcriptional regulator n=1 Tax=Nocardia huaxiensis TaxID=2755382 RepID=A0A7D6VPL9_9NOCA|nr:winged helix-turn-helix transcriptional regulator [Nocardia huaxiensis]